jgi:ABC-type cobalt transport system substrate-binding protein
MEKGDWLLVVILLVIAIAVTLFALNIDAFFPVPSPDSAAKDVIDTINSTFPR